MQPQGLTGPIDTTTGGPPAESPQGETPGVQAAPEGSSKTIVGTKPTAIDVALLAGRASADVDDGSTPPLVEQAKSWACAALAASRTRLSRASTWVASRLVPVPANTRLNLARRAAHSVEVAWMFDSLHPRFSR